MKVPIYQIDAFTNHLFGGNPAAICPLEEWLDDTTLQQIAAENYVPETAFFVAEGDNYRLRWFTPEVEMDLCGHATLASAWVLFNCLDYQHDEINFTTMSGPLRVSRETGHLSLDFPARMPMQSASCPELELALGTKPLELWRSRDILALFANEEQIRQLTPDFPKLLKVPDCFAVIATAPGNQVNFVSRFFAPGLGINEDPVTGSAHCTLIPFWAKRLGEIKLHARQLSARGGELFCEHQGDRVKMAGNAKLFMKGEIYLELAD